MDVDVFIFCSLECEKNKYKLCDLTLHPSGFHPAASIRRCHHWGRFSTNQVPLFCCDRRGWRRLHAIYNLHLLRRKWNTWEATASQAAVDIWPCFTGAGRAGMVTEAEAGATVIIRKRAWLHSLTTPALSRKTSHLKFAPASVGRILLNESQAAAYQTDWCTFMFSTTQSVSLNNWLFLAGG